MTINVQPEQTRRESCYPGTRLGHTNPVRDEELISALDSVVWRIPGSTWWCDTHPGQGKRTPVRYWIRIPHIASTHEESAQLADLELAQQGRYFLARLAVVRHTEQVTLGGVCLRPCAHQELCVETVGVVAGTHWKVYWSDCKHPVKLIPPNVVGACGVREVKQEPLQLGPGVQFSGWVSGHWYSTPKPGYEAHISRAPTPGSITYNWCFLIPICMDRLNWIDVYLLPPEGIHEQSIPPTQSDSPLYAHTHGPKHDRHVYNRQVTSIVTHRTTSNANRPFSTTHHHLVSNCLVKETGTSELVEKSKISGARCLERHQHVTDLLSSFTPNKLDSRGDLPATKEYKRTLLPLLPLLEPDSRLVMLVEDNCARLEHSCPDHVPSQKKITCPSSGLSPCVDDCSYRAYGIGSHEVKPIQTSPSSFSLQTKLRSSSSDLGHDISSPYYTYICTRDGKPAHVNGAIRHSPTTDEHYSHKRTSKMSRERLAGQEKLNDGEIGVKLTPPNGICSENNPKDANVYASDGWTRKTNSKTYLVSHESNFISYGIHHFLMSLRNNIVDIKCEAKIYFWYL